MNEQHEALLNDITRLTIAATRQTGRRAYHEITVWPDGGVWSQVRVLGGDSRPVHGSGVAREPGGQEEALGAHDTIHTLAQQRDALARWIAANRIDKEDAA